MSNPVLHPAPELVVLALRRRRMAVALGVSERTLWDWTREGSIPHVRRGGTVLYPIDAVRRWLDEQVKPTTLAESSPVRGPK